MSAIRAGFDTVRTFLQEAWAELQRVHWPAQKEVRAATWVVLLLVSVIALYLFAVDAFLAWLLRLLIGY